MSKKGAPVDANEALLTEISETLSQMRRLMVYSLIRNGDFSKGADYWFFKTHSHLPWHIKNLWVEVLFDQGWFGLATFVGLLAVAVTCVLLFRSGRSKES